jgi:hypothetical protein
MPNHSGEIGIFEDHESFPDFAIEFPVKPKQFPVRMRREFRRNTLLLLLYFAPFGRPRQGKWPKFPVFPQLTGNFRK